MKFTALFVIFALIGSSFATIEIRDVSGAQVEFTSVVKGVADGIIDSILGLLKVDPLNLLDFNIDLGNLASISLKELLIIGLGDLELLDSSIELNLLNPKITLELNVENLEVVVDCLEVASETLGIDLDIVTLNATISGLCVDVVLDLSLIPLNLNDLDVLVQLEAIKLLLDAKLNGEVIRVDADTEEILDIVNNLLVEVKDIISELGKSIINDLLGNGIL